MTWTQVIRPEKQRTRVRRERAGVVGWRVLTFVVVIGVWWAVTAVQLLPQDLIPNPFAVVSELIRLVFTADFWQAIGATLGGALLGLAAAVLVGIPLGILTGRFDRAELSARFLLDFGRAFPAIALVGVLVLLLGRGTEMKAVLVFIAVVFPLVIQTQHGVRGVSPMIVETSQAFRIPTSLYIRKVLLPSAAPSIMTGLRLAASVAVLVAISAEVLTNAPGLGQRIAEAQLGSNAPKAFAFIVTAGLLGYLVNILIGALQKQIIRWRQTGGND